MSVETDVAVRCAVQGADILGEVPLWCSRTRRLWWTDVRRPAIQSYDPATGRHQALRMHPDIVSGSIALCEKGGLLLAAATGIYIYDPAGSQPPQRIADPIGGVRGMRLNDGKCDRRGRFWVGSMHDTDRTQTGVLYRVDPDGRCTAMLDGFVLPNAICWSPDDRTMYFADTHNQVIWSFDYDIEAGAIANRRVFKDWTHQIGRPDGATVDADGFVWNCMVASGQLIRLAPDGRVDRIIQLPVTNPTCPAFGGEGLRTLYITSHSQRLPPEQLAREPLAGALLTLDVGVRGLPEPRFGG
ncbi:SMP-30/gluconolactonase/LRE family protein [Reyranella sp. CPCC 100927]|uniref:SMP-30/gluconolactonase/LRE family protein n=1 Tax=Reyranella sp. CPCC 100927 TaxID=2599616 RepID=UPI0011B50C79|nr:SMP-30/gluconolactonase/LRE family protein [Reyranella sp. CPCC 100927]TWT03140.1 SMP-30/gluconolactonase/LRE family protein [Reyranella sp. CPCC 100927]